MVTMGYVILGSFLCMIVAFEVIYLQLKEFVWNRKHYKQINSDDVNFMLRMIKFYLFMFPVWAICCFFVKQLGIFCFINGETVIAIFCVAFPLIITNARIDKKRGYGITKAKEIARNNLKKKKRPKRN